MDCLTLDEAKEKGLVCLNCLTKKCKSGCCRDCFYRLTGIKTGSPEAVVVQALSHFFGEWIGYNTKEYVGGVGCREVIDGGDCDEKRKTKRAIPDISMILPNLDLFVEIDEFIHSSYDRSCEASRYDILGYKSNRDNEGNLIVRSVVVIRFNPHFTIDDKTPLLDRLKQLAQLVRYVINNGVPEEEEIGVNIFFLYYPADNKHLLTAKVASATLRVKDYNVDDVILDDDINQFTMHDLKVNDRDHIIVNNMVEDEISNVALDSKGNYLHCAAYNYPNDPVRKRTCSSYPAKGHRICVRHLKMQIAGQQLVLCDEEE